MTIKLDMRKTYDKFEWDMIIAMMKKVGFNQKWRRWIKDCISSVSYRVLINGSLGNELIPSRGIRQGDPLSPFLFLLCIEGLSVTLLDLDPQDLGNQD